MSYKPCKTCKQIPDKIYWTWGKWLCGICARKTEEDVGKTKVKLPRKRKL